MSEIGVYQYGSAYAFMRLADAQKLFIEPDLISVMSFRIDDLYQASQVVALSTVADVLADGSLEDAMRRTYPEFHLRSGVLSWEDYLPPLSENLQRLADQHDSSTAVLAATR